MRWFALARGEGMKLLLVLAGVVLAGGALLRVSPGVPTRLPAWAVSVWQGSNRPPVPGPSTRQVWVPHGAYAMTLTIDLILVRLPVLLLRSPGADRRMGHSGV